MSIRPLHLALGLALAVGSAPSFAEEPLRVETTRDGGSSGYVRKDSESVAIREGVPQAGNNGNTLQAPGVSSDGEALAVLMAINDHQIATADLARQRGVSSAVDEFARDIESAQRANQKSSRRVGQRAGINPFDSDDVIIVRQRSSTEQQALAGVPSPDFELAFLDAMAQINRDAITAIDTALLPASRNPSVQDHLREARERFAGNLNRAASLALPAQVAR